MKRLAVLLSTTFVLSNAVQAESLSFCYDPYPPYTLGTEGTPSGGLKVQLLDAVVSQIDGLTATVTILPWKRCQAEVRAGNIDGILPLFPNEERRTYMEFTDGTFDEQSTLWHRVDQFENGYSWSGDFDEISHLRLGMLTGSYVDEDMEDAFENQLGITRARDIETLMELLVLGRVDLVATDFAVGRHILKENGWQNDAQHMTKPIASRTSHFGLSKASGASRFLSEFDETISALHADGVIEAIYADAQ
ncbi:MAG: transporter substrate-binding domain-containing protein [Sulfitobacter sp.]